MLSSEQHCLWRGGNAFVVNLNQNLNEKKTSCVVRHIFSLYRNQLLYSNLREEFFILHTCLHMCEEQCYKRQRWINLLHGILYS